MCMLKFNLKCFLFRVIKTYRMHIYAHPPRYVDKFSDCFVVCLLWHCLDRNRGRLLHYESEWTQYVLSYPTRRVQEWTDAVKTPRTCCWWCSVILNVRTTLFERFLLPKMSISFFPFQSNHVILGQDMFVIISGLSNRQYNHDDHQ